MATRRLDGESWADALNRIERWRSGDLAVCWAMVRDTREDQWVMLGITVRGGVIVSQREFEYAHLKLQSRMMPARAVADVLRTGHLTRPTGDRDFREITISEGTAEWLTSGAIWGMTGPLPTPSYYFNVQIVSQQLESRGRLSEPAYGPGQLWYPSGLDALFEVLYSTTQHQNRRDLLNQAVIHLPYEDAFIASVGYVDGEGVVVTVGEGGKGWASGHELQALWKIQLSETSYRRAVKVVAQAGAVTFHADAEPAYFAVSLQNEEGSLVDYVERFAQVDAAAEPSQLPSDALPEAFDFLASIWRNVTGKYLFEVHRVSPAGRLTAAVANRGDFSNRMTDFADVVKAMKIDDSFIDAKLARDLTPDKSLGRLKVAVGKLLKSPDADVAAGAIDVLQEIVRVRVALQHEQAQPDLPTSLARLEIKYPADWPKAWEVVRYRAVGALRDLRQA